MGDNIDGMGIENLMKLVINHKEEQHIQEIVPIGEHNPNIFKPQGPDLEEWDTADDADINNT